MAFWVEEHEIFWSFTASFASPNDVMAMPPRKFGDLLVADGTEAILFFPEGEEFPFLFEVGYHVNIEPFLKVLFPPGIVGIGLTLNFAVPFDRGAACVDKSDFSDTLFINEQPEEHPIAVVYGSEIFFLHPFLPFIWVPSLCPSP
jgi:hypothetical protein